jgi:UDP-3-O-[3-hydroxymyristoyl] glucosamine N-acyltransferase
MLGQRRAVTIDTAGFIAHSMAMTKRQFFKAPEGLTLGEIAALTGAQPREDARLDQVITNVAPLDLAGADDLSFFDNTKYNDELAATRAAACLISERYEKQAPAGVSVLRSKEPYRAFVTVARKLFPDSLRPSSVFGWQGVAPTASVHPSAVVESGATVDPGAVIGPDARIGAGTVIGATAVIGPGVQIGRNSAIGAGCSIIHTLIGDRVIIHPGCRIGQDGFGFLMGADGNLKVPQIGRVIIQDDVEIGAGTMIDRGGIRDTVIGEGTKIDNLVQIGHNVVIGRNCIVVAQSGLSGSVTLEDSVVLGARVGIIEHINVGEGAQLAARSTVLRDVPAGARWAGLSNAKPIKQYFRELVMIERVARGADVADLRREQTGSGADGGKK